MQHNQDLITLISKSLDYKSLALLLATCKDNAKLLGPCFTTQARPHLLKHMLQKIIDTRMQTPTNIYCFRTRKDSDNSCSIRFTCANQHAFCRTALFTVSIAADDSICVFVQTGFILKHCVSSSFSLITGISAVHITPSADHPLDSGAVQIAHDAINTCYVNGFDPARIIEWCPIDMPN